MRRVSNGQQLWVGEGMEIPNCLRVQYKMPLQINDCKWKMIKLRRRVILSIYNNLSDGQ